MVLWETKTKGSFFLLTALMSSFSLVFADTGLDYNELLEFTSHRMYSSACYGTVGDELKLECEVGKLFEIHGIFYGMKNNSNCYEAKTGTKISRTCCQPESGDCFSKFKPSELTEQKRKCGGGRNCTFRASRHWKPDDCHVVGDSSHTQFVVAIYSCVSKGLGTDTTTVHDITTADDQRYGNENKSGLDYNELLEFTSHRMYSSACYGTVGDELKLECEVGKLFEIHGIFYGMKNNSNCYEAKTGTKISRTCCQPESGDCFSKFKPSELTEQKRKCGGGRNCTFRASRHWKPDDCHVVGDSSHTQFVVAIYSCVSKGLGTDTTTVHDITTADDQRYGNENKSDGGPVIGAVIGVLILCIMIVAIVVFVIWRRRKRKLSQSAREYIEPTRGKGIQLNAENSYDEIPKETLNSDSHVQNQESGDSKTGYKMSVPADYSYTKIMKVSGIDAGDERNKFVLSEPTAPTINDDYSLAKIESTDDYSLAKPIDNIKTSKLPEQDHYGYSHMPGLEKQARGNNEDYGKLMDTSASSADDYGYSHMEDKRNVTENDSSSPYQHGINAKSEEHDNYGYSHMTN